MNRKKQLIFVSFILLTLSLVLASGVLADSNKDGVVVPGCPYSQGYWANHPQAWPVTGLMLGVQFYSQAELLVFLPGGGGDASTILAVQLAAVKLNLAAGSDPTPISSAVLQADAVLGQYAGKLPYNVSSATQNGQAMLGLAGMLDNYNNGQQPPNCAQTPTATPTSTFTPEPSPTPAATSTIPVTIIIEGPVQAINVNIITIYDIDIEVDINDPILTHIHVGDFVRCEGNVVSGTTMVVVAVTVFVVNVDVVITNNNVIIWQDDGNNCGNPPPPWAPAHGWRRRCQNQNTTIIIPWNSGNNGMGMGMGKDD